MDDSLIHAMESFASRPSQVMDGSLIHSIESFTGHRSQGMGNSLVHSIESSANHLGQGMDDSIIQVVEISAGHQLFLDVEGSRIAQRSSVDSGRGSERIAQKPTIVSGREGFWHRSATFNCFWAWKAVVSLSDS